MLLTAAQNMDVLEAKLLSLFCPVRDVRDQVGRQKKQGLTAALFAIYSLTIRCC